MLPLAGKAFEIWKVTVSVWAVAPTTELELDITTVGMVAPVKPVMAAVE